VAPGVDRSSLCIRATGDFVIDQLAVEGSEHLELFIGLEGFLRIVGVV
jgi:hypothetical protein